MGIGIYNDANPEFPAEPKTAMIEVEAAGIAVDLHGHLQLGGRAKQLVHVDGVWVAASQLASCGVPEDVHVRVFHRSDDPVGHPDFAHFEG